MKIDEIRAFRSILRQFSRLSSVQMKTCCSEVTLAQCLVLFEIEEHGRQAVGQLASRLKLDDSTLSRTIDGLARKGLIERIREEPDRRVVWTQLTPAGKTLCRSLHKNNDTYCRRALQRIAPAERTAVLRKFEILVQAFLDSEESPS